MGKGGEKHWTSKGIRASTWDGSDSVTEETDMW